MTVTSATIGCVKNEKKKYRMESSFLNLKYAAVRLKTPVRKGIDSRCIPKSAPSNESTEIPLLDTRQGLLTRIFDE